MALAIATSGTLARAEADFFTARPGLFVEVPSNEVASDWGAVHLDGVSTKAILNALAELSSSRSPFSTRGRREAEIYRNFSGAVVLVLTDDSLGSGVYLGSNQILTNWHVIRSATSVAIAFKPEMEGDKVDPSEIVKAIVQKKDERRDLALLSLIEAPKRVRPIELGTAKEIEIGADVHAIGHPHGYVWSYTRGIISQYRKSFEWKTKTGKHRASVIQTQTPISVGNSGGPLLAESGRLIGINSMGKPGENLNFAVSVSEVESFLAEAPKSSGARPSNQPCKIALLFKGADPSKNGQLEQFDTNCDGIADTAKLTPADKHSAIRVFIDTEGDKKADIIVEDRDRDGRWDVSYHDVDFDGKMDLVGLHPDGKIQPSKFERYVAR